MLIPLYFDISYNIGWFDTSPEGILNDLTPKENKFLKDSMLKTEHRNLIFCLEYLISFFHCSIVKDVLSK